MYKIAIIGPESTGKTELARNLSELFKSPWVSEYAREYIENLSRPYTYDDVCNIALKQIEQEKSFENNLSDSDFVFFDTELIIIKVWFEYKYKIVPDFLTKRLKHVFFDLYLLCAPDLPWEFDPVREHGTDRDFFFNWYKREIEQTNKPYIIVNGFGDKRIQHAIDALSILKK